MEKLYNISFSKLIPKQFTLLRGYNWQHEENMYVESASSLSEASSTESPAPLNATNCTINGTAGTLASNGTCIATASGGFWSGVGVCNLSNYHYFIPLIVFKYLFYLAILVAICSGPVYCWLKYKRKRMINAWIQNPEVGLPKLRQSQSEMKKAMKLMGFTGSANVEISTKKGDSILQKYLLVQQINRGAFMRLRLTRRLGIKQLQGVN